MPFSVELATELYEVVVLELVRHGERLEDRLIDGAEFLGLVEKMTANQVQQGSSAWFLSFRFSLGLVRMRSIRSRLQAPPLITRKSRPGFPI